MTPVLEKNLALLQANRPALWQAIQPFLDQPFPGQVYAEANDLPSLRWSGPDGQLLNLHPANDPRAGCQECVNVMQGMEGRIIFFLGFGMGYEAMAVCQAYSRLNQIKIIDPNPIFFVQALKYQDLSSIIANSNVDLHLGVSIGDLDTILAYVDRWHLLHDMPFLLSLKMICATDLPWYRTASQRLKRLINYQRAQSMVSIKEAKSMLVNSFQNFSSMVNGLPLDSLAGAFKGRPAILVAAGPSLKKNIERLKGMENYAVIIAVDTAIPRLMAHGISPHFVVAMDARQRNADSLQDHWEALRNTALVYLNCSTPFIPKFFKSPRQYCIFDEAPVNQWFGRMFGQNIPMVSAASVALLGFYTAHFLGCDPIIMIGLDLAFEQDASTDLSKEGLVTLPGIDGNEVLSCLEFQNMIECFESLMGRLPGNFIDATEGGARINHTSVMSLAEAMAPYTEPMTFPELPVNRQVQKVAENCLFYLCKTAEDLKVLISECHQVISLADRAQASLNELDLQSSKPGAGPAVISEKLADDITLARQKHNAIVRNPSDQNFVDFSALLDTLVGNSRLASHRKQIQWKKDHPEIVPGSVTMSGLLGEMDSHRDLCEGMVEAAQWFAHRVEIAVQRLELMTAGKEGLDTTIEQRLRMGEAYLGSMDLEKAASCFKSVIAEIPDNGMAHFGLGRIFMCRRNSENAMRHFMTARGGNPDLGSEIDLLIETISSEYLQAAKDRINRGRPGAKKYLTDILPQFPDYREAQELLPTL